MIVRVGEEGKPAFQLRKGEEGLSAFDTDRVEPPLSDFEILGAFRLGSILIGRTGQEIEDAGLRIEPIEGASELPPRLRVAHIEIRLRAGMSRGEFKRALTALE